LSQFLSFDVPFIVKYQRSRLPILVTLFSFPSLYELFSRLFLINHLYTSSIRKYLIFSLYIGDIASLYLIKVKVYAFEVMKSE